MNWIRDNIGKVISAVAIIFTIIGFLTDRYIMQITIVEDIEKLDLKIQDLKDNDIYYIRQFLSRGVPR